MMKKQPGSRTRASCSRLFSPGKESCRAPVGRGAPPRRPIPAAPLVTLLSLRGRSAPVAIRNTLCTAPLAMPPAVALSATSGRKYPKNAVKTKVLESFRAWNMFRPEVLCPAYQTLSFKALLSYRLCAVIRWPLTRTRATLAYQGCPLRLPCRRENRCPPCHASVGATLAVARPTALLVALRRVGLSDDPFHCTSFYVP